VCYRRTLGIMYIVHKVTPLFTQHMLTFVESPYTVSWYYLNWPLVSLCIFLHRIKMNPGPTTLADLCWFSIYCIMNCQISSGKFYLRWPLVPLHLLTFVESQYTVSWNDVKWPLVSSCIFLHRIKMTHGPPTLADLCWISIHCIMKLLKVFDP
jgi:hypothetical protein